jgi:hypothetical protein
MGCLLLSVLCCIAVMADEQGRQTAVSPADENALSPAAVIAAADLAPASEPEQSDIRGPLGPLQLPDYLSRAFLKHRWLRRIVAGVLAVGFVFMAFHYLLRKRRRAVFMERVSAVPSVHALAAEANKLSDAEFYARLLRVLREALTPQTPRPAAAMTPRELAEMELFALVEEEDAVAGGLHERWRGLCARAERAEYGRARFKGGQRREDLQLVMDLIEKADRRRAVWEDVSEP